MASQRVSILVFTFVSALITFSEARDFVVGGHANSWKIPENSTLSLNEWAGQNRFQIGDSLTWKYDSKVDSVLEVTKADYESCNATKPIKEYKDGNAKVELDRSGAFYFISGAKGHCEKGEKLVVVVMSQKHHGMESPAPAPAPGKNGAGHAMGRDLLSFWGSFILGLACLARWI
ncbi:hypothetical protein SLA2020_176210 [Shorea laevis]